MKKELKSGILSADCRGVNVFAVLNLIKVVTWVGEERIIFQPLVSHSRSYVLSFRRGFSSSLYLRSATLFYRDTPWASHI